MKLLWLFFILLIGVLFTQFIDIDRQVDWFVFVNKKYAIDTIIYYTIEHLIKIILAYLLWQNVKTYKFQVFVFYCIQWGDLVDFFLTDNGYWFGFITYNIVAASIFATSVIYEYGRDHN